MKKQLRLCIIALAAFTLLSLGAKAQYLATWGVRNYADSLAPGSTGAAGKVASGVTASRFLITDSAGRQVPYTGPTLGSGAGARKTSTGVAFYKGGRQMEGVLLIHKKNQPTVDSSNASGLVTASPNFFNTYTPKAYYSYIVTPPSGKYLDINQFSSSFVFTHSPAYNVKIVYYVDDCQHLNPITPDSFLYAGSPVINAKDTLPAHENLINNINAARHPYPYYTVNLHGKTLRVYSQLEVRYYFFNIDVSGTGHKGITNTGRYVGYDTAFVLGSVGTASIGVVPTVATLCSNAGGITLSANNYTNVGSIQNNVSNNPNYNKLIQWSPATGLSSTSGTSVVATPTTTTTYTIGNGCGSQSNTTVTVVAPAQVTLGSTHATACTGSTVAFTASGVTTYAWSPSTSQVFTGLTNVFTATPSTSTIYTVTGTDANGCHTTATDTVTVSGSTAPTITVGRSHIDTCSGSTVSLSASGGISYSWKGSDNSSNTGSSISVSPSSTTLYLVTGVNGSGCSNVALDTIQIGATMLQPITGLVSICNGSSTVLKAIGATTYSWSPSTGLSATTGAQVTANPTATTTYTVTGAIAGCSSTTATVVVTVNSAPSISATNATICNGVLDSLFASNGSTFTWAPYANLSTNKGSKVAASPSVTTTYSVTNENGCVGTYILGVNARPTATVSGAASICNGQSTNVSIALTGSGPWSVTYNNGTSNVSTTASSSPLTLSVAPGATSNYTVVALSDANCSAISSDYSTSNALVTVKATPYAVQITPNIYDICAGTVAKLKVTPAPTGEQSKSFTYVSPDTTASASINQLPAKGQLVVSGLPHGATIDSISIKLNVQCLTNFANDIRVSLQSPNNSSLSLSNGDGATGTNSTYDNGFRNTVFSSTAKRSLSIDAPGNTYANSFTGYYKPYGALGVEVGNYVTPVNVSNVSSFTQMINNLRADSGANGTWTLWTDNTFNGSSPLVTIINYTITFYYKYNPTITYSDTSGLYTDIGASIRYTGTNNDSVYASPKSNKVYTATVTIGTCSATGTATVNVNSNPTVSTSPSITICNGSSTTLTASGSGTFSWSPSTGLSATTGSSVTANPTTTTIYTVTSTTGSCTAIGYDTVNVTTGSGPSITVSPTSANGCGGGSTSLSASGGTSYVWMPATGLSATTGSSVSASPTVTTTYTVVGSNGTCSNSATAVINVGVVAPAPATICSGGSTSLTATGATTYSWSPSTGLSATTGATVTANPTATTTYTVTGNISGCSSTTATVVVTVNPSPSFTVNPSATLCNGGSTYISLPNTTTYSWAPSTGLSRTNGNSVTANPTVTTTYTVTTARNCTATQIVTVNPRPTSVLSAVSNSICNGSSTKLAFALTGSSPWTIHYNGQTVTTSNATDTITITPSATTTYRVTSLTDAHCSATNSADTTGTPTVTVNADSTVIVTPNAPAAVCAGGIDTFVASSHFTGSITVTSGSISKAISQSTASTLNVSGIPANSKVTKVIVTYSIVKSGYTSDLRLNLTTPNNKTLNLQSGNGGTGGQVGKLITISSNGTTHLDSAGYVYTGYAYQAWAGNSIKTRSSITSNVSSFANLISSIDSLSTTGNGNWTFSAYDSLGTGANGTLNNWSMTIYYNTPSPAITWSPTTGLYTDKAATVAYTGGTTNKVYAKPTSTTTYYANVSYGTCSDNTATAVATINPLPTAGFSPSTSINKCSAGAVTLPVALTGSTPWSVTYNDGTNHTVSSASSVYNVLGSVSASTKFVIKSVTDNNGCSAILGSDSARSVYVLSTNATSVSPASSTVCSGNSQAFTLNGYPAGSGAIIKWQYSTNRYASYSGWTGFGSNSTTATLSSINQTVYVRAIDSATGCTVIASTDAVVKVDSASKLSVVAVGSTTVDLSWTPVVGATSYTINYGGSTATTSSTTYTLTGLSACTSYSIYVSPNSSACSVGNSNTVSVKTLPAAITLRLDTSGNLIKAHWNGVKGNRYKLYVSQLISLPNATVFTVSKDTSYTIDLSKATGYKGQTLSMYVVLDSGSTCATKPVSNTKYINVKGGTCTNAAPSGLTASATSNSISLSWSGSTSYYNVYYKTVNGTSWKSYSTSSTSYALTGLSTNTCYVIFISNVCSITPASIGYTTMIDTVCTPSTCAVPTNLVLSNPTCHGFTATWNAISGVSNYSMYYTRTSGVGAPVSFSYRSSTNSYTITSLSPGTSYSMYVKANCTTGAQSNSSNVETITTKSTGCKDDVNGNSVVNASNFNVYPNPNNGNFIVNMTTTATAQTAIVEVMNVLGQLVYSTEVSNNNGQIIESINLNNKAAGLYIVRVRCGNDVQDAKVQVTR